MASSLHLVRAPLRTVRLAHLAEEVLEELPLGVVGLEPQVDGDGDTTALWCHKVGSR